MAASLPMLPHLRRLIDSSAADLSSDAVLLSRFVRDRDEAAFTALVARHGPMVLRLCRRVLVNAHDAEDACQATFLVLARKAHHLRHPETLAAWLHGVAYRLALKARAAEARRRYVETRSRQIARSPSPADPLAGVSGRELLTILDAELQRLPERYRLPLILCCLEGRSQPEAARLLGWTPSSVKGRLDRGRAKLHQRLLRRGLTLSAALLAVEAAREPATARLSATLAASVMRATAGGASAGVVALAEQAIQGMAWSKGKIYLILLLGSALVVGAGAFAQHQSAARQDESEQASGSEHPKSPEGEQQKPRTAKALARADRYGDPLPPGALFRLGTVRLRQQGRFFAFSPDSKRIASAGSDGFVRIRDAISGRELSRLDGCFNTFGRLAYSPNGKLLAVTNFDWKNLDIYLWDTATGKRIRKWSARNGPLIGHEITTGLTFSPDSRLLAIGEEDVGITLWDATTGEKVNRLAESKGGHKTIAFLPDGKRLLASNAEGVVGLWDTRGRLLRKFNTGYADLNNPHAVDADGKTLVLSASRPLPKRGDGEEWVAGLLSVWNVATGKERRRLETQITPGAVALSPDSKTLAYIQDTAKVIQLRDVDSWKEVRRLAVAEGNARDLAFSPDGKTLAARMENALELWDMATGQPLASRPGHTTAVDRLAFTADGRQLISITRNQQMGTARVWDTSTGQYLYMLPEEWNWTDCGVVCPSRDGAMLLLGGINTITLWDVAKRRRVREFTVVRKPAESGSLFIHALALSPDGRRMTSISDREDGKFGVTFLVWDVASGAKLSRRTLVLPEVGNGLHHPHLSPDGRFVATTDGRTIWVRDVVSGAIQRTLHREKPAANEELGALIFSNDGRLLAGISSPEKGASTKGKVRVWEVATGAELPPLADPWALSLAFAPNDRLLATAGGAVDLPSIREKPIRLWDIATGKEVERFEGHGTLAGELFTRSVGGALAFSPDGRTLATGLLDSTVLLWDAKPALRRVQAALPAVQPKDLPRLWADLAGADTRKAQVSLRTMAATPDIALPFLEHRLTAARAADVEQLRRLIADLDSEQFSARKAAAEELRRLDLLAEPALCKTLEGKPSLEGRRRIEELLAVYRAPAVSGETRRAMRAIAVLEHMGSEGSRRLLTRLAAGAPEARLTREAKASIHRLDVRRPSEH